MVVFGKARSARELACEQSAGQRHAGENPNLFLFGFGKELFSGSLPEAIKDDLHRLYVGVLGRLQRLFNFLDAHPVIANFPGLHQVIEHAEHFRPMVKAGRRAMQLQQINGVGCQIAQAVLNPVREILAAVTFDGLFRQAPSRFGRNDDLLLARFS